MGKTRRFVRVATSDDEDDVPVAAQSHSSNTDEERTNQRKRKKMMLNEEDEEEEEEQEQRGKKKAKDQKSEASADEDEDKAVQEDAKPIGDIIRVSGKGRGKRNHYEAFEYDGLHYDLEDSVLLVPEESNQKPYVAIIKDITQRKDGSMMVTGQWFYRPEEAEKRGGGNWQSRDTRELFYSFHHDEVPAESVMHKCVVHFIPLNKQIPIRKQHPGFIVQKVYDTDLKRLFKLTDKDYEDSKQHELDILVQKTLSRLGDLPDINTEDNSEDQEDQLKNKRLVRRKNMSPLDVSREEEATARSGQLLKPETPGSCPSNASEYYNILANFKVLTGETQRDKWLEKLLQGIQYICTSTESEQSDGKERSGCGVSNPLSDSNGSRTANGSRDKNGDVCFRWPDAVVPSVAALEKVSHEALSSDFQKYNQKMRQLSFNLKNSAVLARRLLNGELKPSEILNMSPNELKEGLTAEEIASKQPEESARMQITDARCKKCMEKKAGLIDIIQAGLGARYQLYCIACGNTWYASRDEASTLIDGPSSARSVGTAPWATAKFEDIEKTLVSPREPDKSIGVLKKTTEPYMPVLDKQKSFNKSRTEASTIIDGPSSARSVGTAPWATAKFEDVEKTLVSPREPEKTVDVLKKTTEPYRPVLDKQKSFNKSRTESNSAS